MQDFTFSDGTVVPAGASIGAPMGAIHRDPENYEDPGTFDGFRFWRIREKMRDKRKDVEFAEDGEEWRICLTGAGTGYLAFGGGCHVWYCTALDPSGVHYSSLVLQPWPFLRIVGTEVPHGVYSIKLRHQDAQRKKTTGRYVVWNMLSPGPEGGSHV